MAAKYKFVSEPENDLLCVICQEVAEDPWQHDKCGRLLCVECLFQLGIDQPCPNCRGNQPQYFEDNRSRRAVRAIPVKCDNIESGCQWIGGLGEAKHHVPNCGFTLVICPNSCETRGMFMRKDLRKHLENDCPNRHYECEHCGKEDTYIVIITQHDAVCEMKRVTCPNDGCSDMMQRRHIQSHMETECEYSRTPCKYRRLGCSVERIRKEMPAHEKNDSLHLHMAIDMTTRLEKRLLEQASTVFKVTEYQHLKESNSRFYSPKIYTSPEGYCMQVSIYPNGYDSGEDTHVSCFVWLEKGNYDADLKWPFVGDVTVTLLNQYENDNHYSRKISFELEDDMWADDNCGYFKFIPHSMLAYNPERNTQYLSNDTLYFRVTVENIPSHKPWLECTTK